MGILKIEGTQETLAANFDREHNALFLNGRSINRNAVEVLIKTLDWLKNNLNRVIDNGPFTVNVKVDCINGSSWKMLSDLFFLLFDETKGSNKILVNWFYENCNDEIKQLGEDFHEDFDFLDFRLAKINDGHRDSRNNLI